MGACKEEQECADGAEFWGIRELASRHELHIALLLAAGAMEGISPGGCCLLTVQVTTGVRVLGSSPMPGWLKWNAGWIDWKWDDGYSDSSALSLWRV